MPAARWAVSLFGNILCFRVGRGWRGGQLRHRRRRRRCLLLNNLAVHHTAFRTLLVRIKGESKTGQKENRGEDRGHSTQKICRATGSEKTPGRTAAECSTHVGTLAVLHQDQPDNTNGGKCVKNPDCCLHVYLNYGPEMLLVEAARQILANSSAFKEAPPTKPPSTSGKEHNCAAFPAFTLPP